MLDFALGDLGLSPTEFWQLTPVEFDRAARGYERRHTDGWRRTRWLGTLIANINRAKDTPAMSPEEMMWLPGDPVPTPPLSEEEFDATMARLAEFDNLPWPTS